MLCGTGMGLRVFRIKYTKKDPYLEFLPDMGLKVLYDIRLSLAIVLTILKFCSFR